MSKSKLAIFDIDGTLVDSVVRHQTAFLKALDAFSFKNYSTDFGSYTHHTDSYIFKTIFEDQRRCDMAQGDIVLFEKRLLHYLSLLVTEEPIIEIQGAGAYLQYLRKQAGVDVVFATGSLLMPAKLKLEQACIFIEDELLVTANHIFSRDEIVATAITRARQFYDKDQYDEIVSFGDGRWDYETAKRLNIDFIGIADERLLDLNPARFYKHYSEIDFGTF